MIESKEKLKPAQIAFFDADKTLWQVVTLDRSDDWASKIDNPTFIQNGENTVIRKENGTKFILKDGVKDCLEKLSKAGIGIGIISDNKLENVATIASLFGISDYFDTKLINISLWKGPCPKEVMVDKVVERLGKDKFSGILLVDDKDYSEVMTKSGYSFILSSKDTFPKDMVLSFFGLK